MIELPHEFIDMMKEMLGDQAEEFLQTYNEPRSQGLRINPLKLCRQLPLFDRICHLFGLTPVSWCENGYYYSGDARPGKHPYHAAGLYYIQEPSAMSAVRLLDPQPGDLVLDLAAAPGGKSTQIAGMLQGRGVLVANEIHPARAAILSENIERMGIANAIVTNASPPQLAEAFPGLFDRIMVDAPCSGEGMFRKDSEAIREWSPEHAASCAVRQRHILADALRMLKLGGLLAYSTCTFNRMENEETVQAILADYPFMELKRIERFWPHQQKGEGHFVALLRHNGQENEGGTTYVSQSSRIGSDSASKVRKPSKDAEGAFRQFTTFAEDFIPGLQLPSGIPVLFGEQLYLLPQSGSFQPVERDLKGIRIPRPGLHLAVLKKNRIEPAHALALAVKTTDTRQSLDLQAEDNRVLAYLRGEALTLTEQWGYDLQGWVLLTVDGFPLGWGKASGGQLKNHYPKGLRWM